MSGILLFTACYLRLLLLLPRHGETSDQILSVDFLLSLRNYTSEQKTLFFIRIFISLFD